MEVVTIESKAYQELVAKIEKITQFIEDVAPSLSNQEDTWLDTNEVCKYLKISSRTLQRMRKEGRITFYMNGGHCLYKLSEIEQMILSRKIITNPKTLKEQQHNYHTHVE